MKTALTTLYLFAALCGAAFADIIYDIDYEPPTYTNGQQVGAGSGRTISDSISGFSSQGILLHDGAGGGLSYRASDPFTSGIHLVTWDFAVPVEQGSTAIINGQLDSFDGLFLFDTTVAGDGSGLRLEYGSGFPQRPNIPLNAGQAYSLEVMMNLDADHYSFWVDGNLLEDTVSIPTDADLWEVDFGQNQMMGLQAGIDNFRWQVIPEPSSMLLLLSGGLLLMIRFRKRQRM